jgi:hypothetical protein
MRHGQGTKYNTDVHNAVGTIKKYNADQEIDEAPYKLGGARAKDWATSKLGGKMAKGRHGAGKLANQVNKEWQTFMGTKGYNNAEEATIKDLSDFIEKLRPGTDSKAFFDKAGLTSAGPQVTLTTDQQDAVVGDLGAALAAQGAGQEPAGDGAAGATGGTGATGGAGSATRSAADIARGASGGTRTDPSVGAAGDPPTTPTTPTTPTPPPAKTAELANFIENLDPKKIDELANILNLAKSRG